MKHLLPLDLRFGQPVDDVARPVASGVTARREHDAEGAAGVPVRLFAVQFPTQGRQAVGNQVRAHAQHDGLGLGVAEPAVVLDHLRCAVGHDHQPGVEEAGVGVTFCRHAPDRGEYHLVHDALVDHVGDHGGGAVGPHAAGVEPGVAVTGALVVLARRHRQHVFAVGHDDETGLLAVEVLLDDDPAAGLAEGVPGQHVAHRRLGLFPSHRHDDPLARGQPVGLDDNGRPFGFEVGERRVQVREGRVLGGGDALAGEKVLGEALRALELGRRPAGPEAAKPRGFKGVHDPRDEGRLGTHDGEVDAVVAGEGDQPLDVGRRQGQVLHSGLPRGAGVSRCDENPLHQGGAGCLPCQGVLPAAAADDENLHVEITPSARIK